MQEIFQLPNESITIGENIQIVIMDVQNGKVKFSINAPNNVPIRLKEKKLTRNIKTLKNKIIL